MKLTPQHLLLNPGNLRKASTSQLESLRRYMKQRGWTRHYHHDRRMYGLLREGLRRLKAGDIPGITLREMMRIARALGYKLTVEFVDKESRKTSRPNMSRELAEQRAVGESNSSSFEGTSFLASMKKRKEDFIELQRDYEKLVENYKRIVKELDRIKQGKERRKLGPGLPRKELLELHKRALERVRKMTPEEGFRSLVASGIYTPDGKLAKEYGGP